MSELQAQMLQQQNAMFENMTAMLMGILQQFQPATQTMPPLARRQTTRYASATADGLWQYSAAANAIASNSKLT